jgi:hypothetical protein
VLTRPGRLPTAREEMVTMTPPAPPRLRAIACTPARAKRLATQSSVVMSELTTVQATPRVPPVIRVSGRSLGSAKHRPRVAWEP